MTEQAPVNLTSGDVVHAFWVPEFLFKRHVIPGHPNHIGRITQDTRVIIAQFFGKDIWR